MLTGQFKGTLTKGTYKNKITEEHKLRITTRRNNYSE